MNEHVLEIRKSLKLSQDAFAKRLGMKGSSISLVESGKRNLTDQMIKSICREFNVNEQWFRTGTGEMFLESTGILLTDQIKRYNLSDFDTRIVEEYMRLAPEHRQVMKDYILSVAKSLVAEEVPTVAPLGRLKSYTDEEFNKLTREQQLQILSVELDEEEKGRTSQASTDMRSEITRKMA